MDARPILSAAWLLGLSALLGGCTLFRPDPPEYDAVVLESGVVVKDLVVPEAGATAREGDAVAVEYDLALESGEQVDSSRTRAVPVRFRLGEGRAPAGLEQGLIGMRLFGRRLIIVPPELAYGEAGRPPRIPPNATVRFDVELVELEAAPSP